MYNYSGTCQSLKFCHGEGHLGHNGLDENVWYHISLLPSPSHHSVFDRLQYAKMEGEGLVHFIT